MSAADVARIIAQLTVVMEELQAVKKELAGVKKVVNRVGADWRGVKNVIEDYGNEISLIKGRVSRIVLRCALMRQDTDEFCKVQDDDSAL